jgi:hypothetical protein
MGGIITLMLFMYSLHATSYLMCFELAIILLTITAEV